MKRLITFAFTSLASLVAAAAPVALDWQAKEQMPASVARPFSGFLPNGDFLVAGGSDFVDGKKVWTNGVYVRRQDGAWSRLDALSLPCALGVSDGVSCETPKGVFCAGGRNGETSFKTAFLLTEDGSTPLPDLPEPVSMGAAVSDGKSTVYVIGAKEVYALSLAEPNAAWQHIATLLGPAREQHVAAFRVGDQKAKMIVVYGGYDVATKRPLSDGIAILVEKAAPDNVRALSPLPEKVTTIGAAFLPSGNQHVLLVGGFGYDGWIDRACNGSKVTDPAALGWQRTVWAYNAVTDAWFAQGEIAADDAARCGAAVALKVGKTPEDYTLIVAGGEVAPALRTNAVSVAHFRKVAKFAPSAWIVVGLYVLVMAVMAIYFIRKKKDENDYFRGGNRIPWYVAGMSIFATMLSSITFIAIPTQAYLADWRYFVMAFFIIGMAPVAIYYYLPFFCRLGITSAYEYLERRFNLGVRLFGSAAFVVFMVCRVAVVTLLPAIALNAVTGVSIDACILVCGVLTMVYCSLGGLEAVIWSDFVQGIVLMGGAIAVLVILVMKTGPEGAHLATFVDIATTQGKTTMFDFRFLLSEPVFWVVAVQGLVSNLSSYTSDQCVIQRYIATPDENATKRSLWFNGGMSVLAQIVFYSIGTALYAHYRSHPEMMDVTMPKADSVLPLFMASELSPYLAGLVIAAVFAATISTLSANLSSASTAVVTDFLKRFNPSMSGRAQIRAGQICTYIVGLLGIFAALVLARAEASALFDNFNKYIAMLTAGLTGLFFMGIFMPRVKGVAAILGLLANYAVCFGFEAVGCSVFGHRFHPFLLGGFGLVACVVVAYLASFVIREKGHDLAGLTLKTLKKK